MTVKEILQLFIDILGELPTSALDMEDEKKRSVRFADFERKALDIRFQFSDSEDSLSVIFFFVHFFIIHSLENNLITHLNHCNFKKVGTFV